MTDALTIIEAGTLADGEPGVILRGSREAVKRAAKLFDEPVVLVEAAGYVTPEPHAAALREAWKAGRDAVIAEAERGAGEIGVLLDPTDAQRNKQLALLQLAANASALTPPAPKGDDR
jgi:hypothetical protein